jgi:hypothetical protein
MIDKYTYMTKIEGIEPEKAASAFGFDTGYAYAIRAIPPDGKTETAQEAEMAQLEQLIDQTHLRSVFRRHWLKGYHAWHVHVRASDWLERTYRGREMVQRHMRQLGDDVHDPWAYEYRMVDPVSKQYFDGTTTVYWIASREGIPVNGWMVAQSSEPNLKGRLEGISIRVLPCCGNTLLQIEAQIVARFIQFIHAEEEGCCTHLLKQGVPNQAVLCDEEMGFIVVHSGTTAEPQEDKITFQVMDGELVNIDNPCGFPLHVEAVL